MDRMSSYAVQKLRETVLCDRLHNHLDTVGQTVKLCCTEAKKRLQNHLDAQGKAKHGQKIKVCCADTKKSACGHKGKDVKQLSPGTQSTGHYLLVQRQGHPLPVTESRQYETKHRVWAFYPQRIHSAQHTQHRSAAFK